MKRERIPVTVTHTSGQQHIVGYVSRVTSTCLAAFLKREGFAALDSLGVNVGPWEHVGPGPRYRAGEWTLAPVRS